MSLSLAANYVLPEGIEIVKGYVNIKRNRIEPVIKDEVKDIKISSNLIQTIEGNESVIISRGRIKVVKPIE